MPVSSWNFLDSHVRLKCSFSAIFSVETGSDRWWRTYSATAAARAEEFPWRLRADTCKVASYDSIYGTVACRWERSDAGVRYTAEIPPNTAARVELPGMEPFEVKAGKYEWMAETEKMTQKK